MEVIKVRSDKRGQVIDITVQVQGYITKNGFKSGTVTVYCPHTTAGVTSNENADPDVKSDFLMYMNKTVPNRFGFSHGEGNADAHIKGILTGLSQTYIVEEGRIQLGTWQGIFFVEYDGPRSREVWLKSIPS